MGPYPGYGPTDSRVVDLRDGEGQLEKMVEMVISGHASRMTLIIKSIVSC